ncbi:hypothetical protein E5335_04780 [Coriobacteriaceae bacterium]|uniref:CYTH domain-containing protein n=1 Tax=Granulimonas faecalis TaxID=2894155 RepID=A0AAV5B1V4_9ACTN|nr:hypothetical protein [Granulimonas faecalis]MBF0599703.1 hypothetical protein [Atopobiaceae bacterium FL090493]TGY59860.1 hypothetical protein E5335_04780 [Coriobacteriaceae bacterium]GJM54480.1 hypothetical protein ATOP_01350 [Granulimonas faecalis]
MTVPTTTIIDQTIPQKTLNQLKGLIGQQLVACCHDRLLYNPISYRGTEVQIGAERWLIVTELETIDYLGSREEVSRLFAFDLTADEANDLDGAFDVRMTIGKPINDIVAVTDIVKYYDHETLTWESRHTQALAFLTDGKQIALERADRFEEGVAVLQSPNVLDRLTPLSNELFETSPGCRLEGTRILTSLTEEQRALD